MPPAPKPRAELSAIVAISHPARRRLLESLQLDGPATVGALAERTGQGPGNVSHHMKVLHEAGLVAEAAELARDRREHWWRTVPQSLSWSARDFADEPAGETVALAAEEQNLNYHAEKVREWFGHRPAYAPQWQEAAFANDWWVRVTPAELAQLADRISAVVAEYTGHRDRAEDDPDRADVYLFAHGFPGRPA